jgi:hypothetical protein
MTSPYTIITFALTSLLTSCMYLMNDTEHKDFEAHSDCRVYKREVATENYPFGRVEFIDTSKASGCAKEQLKNVYLLYHDTICVAVYNEHPKTNIDVIEGFIKKYQTDTTRLADFIKFDNSIRITVSRLCKDSSEKYHYGEYVEWRDIEYSILTTSFVETKESLITTLYKWTE